MSKPRKEKIAGKLFYAVDAEFEKGCKGCYFKSIDTCNNKHLCMAHKRKDHRSVIFAIAE